MALGNLQPETRPVVGKKDYFVRVAYPGQYYLYYVELLEPFVVQFYHNESAYQHVEQASKDERDECAAHDDDVVRHAEIGRREVDEQRGGIDTMMRRIDRDEYGRR